MASTELMIAESFNILAVFDKDGSRDVLDDIKKQARSVVRDISTKEGRANIASLARKIASSKTFLDDAGKKLTEDWKARSKIVDIERKRIRDELDALKEEIRKPLTDFENQERDRTEAHENNLKRMYATFEFGYANPSIESIQSRRSAAVTIYTSSQWEEFRERADQAFAIVCETLQDALGQAEHREKERAELERLRREEEARRQAERDTRIAAEAAERAKREAEEESRLKNEEMKRLHQWKQDELKRERDEQEQRAKRAEAEQKAFQEKTERDHKAFIQQEQAKREKAAKDIEEAAQKRENNRKHRLSIHKDIEDCLIADSILTTAQAKNVIDSIVNGQILHVKIVY